jgi:hypothetical protein
MSCMCPESYSLGTSLTEFSKLNIQHLHQYLLGEFKFASNRYMKPAEKNVQERISVAQVVSGNIVTKFWVL